RFVLQNPDGSPSLEVADAEPAIQGERLELLTVVRGLEALPQPSRVTVVTPSAYVNRGLNYGLEEWRENNWHWERHGDMVPVKNSDLWRRLDSALRIHQVECRLQRITATEGGMRKSEEIPTAQPRIQDEIQQSKPEPIPVATSRKDQHQWRR